VSIDYSHKHFFASVDCMGRLKYLEKAESKRSCSDFGKYVFRFVPCLNCLHFLAF